jgi:hypothetical protein
MCLPTYMLATFTATLEALSILPCSTSRVFHFHVCMLTFPSDISDVSDASTVGILRGFQHRLPVYEVALV